MKIRNYIAIACLAVILPVFSGCNSWLDVKPVDRVLEDQLYETEEGFKQALNGIYIELNQNSLYGGQLMFNMVEILAQRYYVSTIGKNKNLVQYNYKDDDVKASIDAIWQKAYSLIMNCNKLLENADLKKDVFTGDNYNLIKGEALALRAFLHFDLLRLFGPVYKSNPDAISICYNTKFSLTGSALLPASGVIEKVLADLTQAEVLLANDPIITKGPLASDGKDEGNDLRYRNLRLNYYAVQALQARVYLYSLQNGKALETARKLVEVQEKWFPLVEFADIKEATNKNPDRVFSTELLFALQNKKRADIFTSYFSSELDASVVLAPAEGCVSKIYDKSDWRNEPMWIIPVDGKFKFPCFHKYEKTENVLPFIYLLPMIRISEMFFIVAETTDDEVEAKSCLNLLRRHRGQIVFEDADVIDVKTVVGQEYMKEFFGEGQLFYYYKRINAPVIPDYNNNTEITMDASKYVLPLPDSELDYRN